MVRRVLRPEDTVWIDGGTVASEDDFWQVIVQRLELFQQVQTSSSTSTATTIAAKASAGANYVIVKGQGEVSGGLTATRAGADSQTRVLSARVLALQGLRNARLPLVVDDFHYLPRDLQGSVIRALKPLIFDGLPVVIIAIPHRRYNALKVEKEMTGRIAPLQVPAWSAEELSFIPSTGFALLDLTLSSPVTARLAEEAIGSPHLMQDFCRSICRAMDVVPPDRPSSLNVTDGVLKTSLVDVAETIGRPIFEKLARGPRSRTDRIERQLRDGSTGDIYELVLHALAFLKPGLISIEYEDLRSAIRSVSASHIPQLQEVARVLKHMATIAASDEASTPVIDFEEQDKRLHITDPFFAFYLRWGELSRPSEG